MQTTLRSLIERCNAEVLEHLDREVTIPVLTSLQAQGDLLVVPVPDDIDHSSWSPVPPSGIVVLQGQHDHRLLADGDVAFAPDVVGQRLGWLRVSGVAWLLHQEHGGSGIGTGTYELRRQREQAQEQRLVAD
jgi:hypothetical protein